MIKILGRTTSINVRKVLWTAAETEVAFVHESAWAADRPTSDAAFLALNPNGLVPVLVAEEGVLWESNTICRYLAARANRQDLLPVSAFARAEVEKWMDWQAADLNAAWRPAFMALVRRQMPAGGPDVMRSIERWNAMMLLLEQRLAITGAFVTGDRFTVADVGLGLSLQRWLLTPMPRPDTPALLAYRARLQARPAARAWIAPDVP
jgi:glutathione S-transferase